ncbi:MAG: EpsG family protein [Duncaniella sp.]|nr:EpsG family protein [Muribaculum sp.]MCM1254622.1 EpsG family protein [Duncaniella sp.]
MIFAVVFNKANTNNLFIIIICGIVLIIFAGFRYEDADWWAYVEMFKDAITGKQSELNDSGFMTILSIIGKICKSPAFMFSCVALASVSLNFKSFLKYTPYVFIAILLYFVHNFALKEMIQIRIGLASAICLYSIRYFSYNRYNHIIALWLLSMSIHITTIIFGILILSYRFKPSKVFLLYSVCFSLLLGLVFPLGEVIRNFTGLSYRLDQYVAYGDSGYGSAIGIFRNLNTLKTLIFFSLFYHYFNILCKINKFFYPLILSYTIGLCWLLCFNDFAIVGARMSNIMLSVEPILLSLPLVFFKGKKFWLYKILLILLSIIIFANNIAPNKISSYKFYFNYT